MCDITSCKVHISTQRMPCCLTLGCIVISCCLVVIGYFNIVGMTLSMGRWKLMLCYITMSAFKIVLFIRASVGIASMEWVISHVTDSPNIATDKHQTHITTPVSIGTAKPKPKYIPCHFQFFIRTYQHA